MKNIYRVVFLFSFLLLGACISYTDKNVRNLDRSKFSVVLIDTSIKTEEIDGKRVPFNWLTAIDKLSLPPGWHTFKIIWSNVDIRTDSIVMKQNLEAGKTYKLIRTVNKKNMTWNFQFIEQPLTSGSN